MRVEIFGGTTHKSVLTLLSKCLAFNPHLKIIWDLQKSWKQCHREFQNTCTQVPQMLTSNLLSHLLYPYLFTYLSTYHLSIYVCLSSVYLSTICYQCTYLPTHLSSIFAASGSDGSGKDILFRCISAQSE